MKRGNDAHSVRRRATSGVSLIEVIIVVAIVGVLTSLAAFSVRPSTAQTYANTIHSFIMKARFDAVRLNQPVHVSWNAVAGTFEARLGSANAWCAPNGEVLAQMEPLRIDRLDVTVIGDTLVWIPSGQVRTCNGGFVAPVVATIRDRAHVRLVEIGAGGLVEVRTP